MAVMPNDRSLVLKREMIATDTQGHERNTIRRKTDEEQSVSLRMNERTD